MEGFQKNSSVVYRRLCVSEHYVQCAVQSPGGVQRGGHCTHYPVALATETFSLPEAFDLRVKTRRPIF